MNNRKKAGAILIVIANVFGWLETSYFGYNWRPKSTAELCCDSLGLVVCAIGFYLFISKKMQP